MGHHSGAYDVAQSGYQQYTPAGSVGVAGDFNAYSPAQTNAANINQSGGAQFSASQAALANQLAAQAAGTGGPNMAQEQMRQAEQGNLASTLAAQASARGNQNPGEAQRQIGQNQAAINAGAAGQAGQVAAQQQLGAQQALAGVNQAGFGMAAQQAGFNQQAALANQQAQNQGSQFNAQTQQALAALQNQQSQFQNTLGAQQQNAYNQAVTGYGSANNNSTNTAANAAYDMLPNAVGGAASGAASAGVKAAAAADGTGGPVSTPITTTVGEAGPEIAKLAPGSEVIPLDRPNTGQGIKPIDNVQALLQHPDFIKAVKDAVGDQVMAHRMAALEAAMAMKGKK